MGNPNREGLEGYKPPKDNKTKYRDDTQKAPERGMPQYDGNGRPHYGPSLAQLFDKPKPAEEKSLFSWLSCNIL